MGPGEGLCQPTEFKSTLMEICIRMLHLAKLMWAVWVTCLISCVCVVSLPLTHHTHKQCHTQAIPSIHKRSQEIDDGISNGPVSLSTCKGKLP